MLGRGRLDALRCLLRACSHLSSPLDLQRSSPPVRSFLLDRLACVGLTSRVHIVGARAPLHCRPFAASAADGEDAARHAGEALDEKLREPTQPDRLQRSDLFGSLLTAEERAEVYAEQSELQKARMPKGVPTANNIQAANLASFWSVLNLSTVLQFKRASEAKRASYAFAKIGASEADTEWMGIKVVTAVVHPTTGRLMFNITVSEMWDCLKDGLCVLFIGLKGGQPSIVYLLHGPEALAVLDSIPESSKNILFTPRLDAKRMKHADLPNLLQRFRKDIRDITGCANVFSGLLEALDTGMLQPFSAFEDADPWFEQVKVALAPIGWTLERRRDDDSLNYVLKHDGNIVRVQHKMAGPHSKGPGILFHMRSKNRLPYDPNHLEVIHVSECVKYVPTGFVYALPLRGDTPPTKQDLGKTRFYIGKTRLDSFQPNYCDLTTAEGAQKFADICLKATYD